MTKSVLAWPEIFEDIIVFQHDANFGSEKFVEFSSLVSTISPFVLIPLTFFPVIVIHLPLFFPISFFHEEHGHEL